ncbi:MAG: hypothetical protein KKB37_14505 [Alphaproteobacteria bacterium]|nr:hypothetical protein [Alphaproteobacteria bacterium]
MTDPTDIGFAMAYAKGKGAFRVYIAFVACAVFLVAGILRGSEIAYFLAFLAGGTSFYFYPLTETDRPRIGAGEHGIFIEGFGLIPWRSVRDISLSTYYVRSIQVSELHIALSRQVPNALAADWRQIPFYRLLMKLPWQMRSDNIVRINLEPFPGTPEEILRAFLRKWRFFGR